LEEREDHLRLLRSRGVLRGDDVAHPMQLPDMEPELKGILCRCLRVDPELRPSAAEVHRDAQELWARLQQLPEVQDDEVQSSSGGATRGWPAAQPRQTLEDAHLMESTVPVFGDGSSLLTLASLKDRQVQLWPLASVRQKRSSSVEGAENACDSGGIVGVPELAGSEDGGGAVKGTDVYADEEQCSSAHQHSPSGRLSSNASRSFMRLRSLPAPDEMSHPGLFASLLARCCCCRPVDPDKRLYDMR
jgi:hypothetical protein